LTIFKYFYAQNNEQKINLSIAESFQFLYISLLFKTCVKLFKFVILDDFILIIIIYFNKEVKSEFYV